MDSEAIRRLILTKLADGRAWQRRNLRRLRCIVAKHEFVKGSAWPAAKRRCSFTSGVSGSGTTNDGRSWKLR